MVKGNTHTNVIFDCVLPVDSKMSDNELKEKVSAAVKEKFPDYRCVISIDRGYTTDDWKRSKIVENTCKKLKSVLYLNK